MAAFYQVREKLKKKCKQQQPDMHAIDVGISSNDYFAVPETIQTILNIQGVLQ
jgi:hypothetical protein